MKISMSGIICDDMSAEETIEVEQLRLYVAEERYGKYSKIMSSKTRRYVHK